MKRVMVLCAVLAGCIEGVGGLPAGTGAGSSGTASLGGGGVPTEYMVFNGKMSFEECRARGNLIITDPGTSMVACDASVHAPEIIEQANI